MIPMITQEPLYVHMQVLGMLAVIMALIAFVFVILVDIATGAIPNPNTIGMAAALMFTGIMVFGVGKMKELYG